MTDHTTDRLFDGLISIRQKRDGYRFTIDPVLLAHFVKPGGVDRVVDLGTGSGIIPIILSHRYPELAIAGVELQDDLAKLAKDNVMANSLGEKIRIFHGDMVDNKLRNTLGENDLVVSNPPYIKKRSGRINPIHEKALARHEIAITLSQLIETAYEILKPHGRFAVILPVNRQDELLEKLVNSGFQPSRLRFVLTMKSKPPKRVLVESVKCGETGSRIEPPLIVYEEQGVYSAEVSEMFV